MATTIKISDKLWSELNGRKFKEEDTFESIIWKLIESRGGTPNDEDIQISSKLWKELDKRKMKGETFEMLLWRLIEIN